MGFTDESGKKGTQTVVEGEKLPIYRRSNSVRSRLDSRGRIKYGDYCILNTINRGPDEEHKRKGMGLSLKFVLPVILVFIVVVGLFTYFIARTSVAAIVNEILKSGLAESTVLSNVGSMIIEKSDRTFYLKGPKGNYEPWPVDLGLISKENFLKNITEYPESELPPTVSPGFRRNRETLYAARTGGLLKDIITYRSFDGTVRDSQTVAAYIVVTKDKVIKRYTRDIDTGFAVERPKMLLLARSESDMEIDDGNEGILPIKPSDWVNSYADISECTIGGRKVIFGTKETPCIVYGAVVRFDGLSTESKTEKGKQILALVFNTPIFDSNNFEVGRAIIAVRASQIVDRYNKIYTVFALEALVVIALSIIISFIVSIRVTRPIKLLLADMRIVASGDLTHETRSYAHDEIGMIASEFNRLTRVLKMASENEKKALKLESELNMAGEIQFKLLPTKLLEISGIDIFAAYQPAKEVGGDYYDLFQIDDTHFGMVVADVSGKGVPASMVMATTRTILRFVARNNISTVDTLVETNSMVAADIKRGMFVTALYLVFDSETQSLECASAGHNPLVLHRQNGEIELINPKGIAIGFDKGPIFNNSLQKSTIKLQRGDRVVLYTDGIVEAMNEERQHYTDERFYDFIRENSELDSHGFVHKLLEDVEEHQGRMVQHDDITVLTFKAL